MEDEILKVAADSGVGKEIQHPHVSNANDDDEAGKYDEEQQQEEAGEAADSETPSAANAANPVAGGLMTELASTPLSPAKTKDETVKIDEPHSDETETAAEKATTTAEADLAADSPLIKSAAISASPPEVVLSRPVKRARTAYFIFADEKRKGVQEQVSRLCMHTLNFVVISFTHS
jgi:hypothetical protein